MHRNATWRHAAALIVLLALPPAAWAQAKASWTATGPRQDCAGSECLLVFFDSNQVPGEPITLDGSASAPLPGNARSWRERTIDGQPSVRPKPVPVRDARRRVAHGDADRRRCAERPELA